MASKATTKTGDSLPTTYDDIIFSSYYSYFYYYPTIHWNLDRTPETNDYWVGIYKKDASNKDYITYQWIKNTMQGKYYVGKIKSKYGAGNPEEYYELRVFKGGYCRIKAETNHMWGKIAAVSCDPFDEIPGKLFTTKPAEDVLNVGQPLDPVLKAFRDEVEEALEAFSDETNNRTTQLTAEVSKILETHHMNKKLKKQAGKLVEPLIEQANLPAEIRKPGPREDDRPEPKILFPGLGDVLEEKQLFTATGPSKIVLTITLGYCYTYVYPLLNTKTTLPQTNAWAGLFRSERDVCYSPSGKIDSDWQWVGPGKEGETKLDYIKEEKTVKIAEEYVGGVFDGKTDAKSKQIGIAGTSIIAVVNTSKCIPPPVPQVLFDKDVALTCAELSELAYEDYSYVQSFLPSMGFEPLAEINQGGTEGFIAESSDAVVIAYRGTQELTDFLTDAYFLRKPVVENGPEAHGGFVDALTLVYDTVSSELPSSVDRGKKLLITGHSLGGALATLTAYRLYDERPPRNIELYVYGCPPSGDWQLANFFKPYFSFVITIEGDPVSSGALLGLGAWVKLFKPNGVHYLPRAGGHGIKDYINQLKKLP